MMKTISPAKSSVLIDHCCIPFPDKGGDTRIMQRVNSFYALLNANFDVLQNLQDIEVIDLVSEDEDQGEKDDVLEEEEALKCQKCGQRSRTPHLFKKHLKNHRDAGCQQI